jgi:hypothetical protein
MMSQVAEQVAARCASCGQPLTGRYCAHCGEKVLDPEALTVRHFIIHTLVDELAHLDGKFWRTLRSLMFRPGFLTAAYSAGRRRLYISPAKLLISSIITYALLTQGGFVVTLSMYRLQLSIAPTAVPDTVSVAETVTRIDRFGVLANGLAAKEQSGDTTSEGVRERFHRKLNQFAQPLSFANVVLLALALYLFFHRKRPLLVEHAVFSMHLVSFVLVSSLALLPAVWMLKTDEGAGVAWASETHLLALAIILGVFLWQFAYLTMAIRRFYFGRDPRTARPRLYAIAAALLIYILNSAFITAVQMVGGAIALRSI